MHLAHFLGNLGVVQDDVSGNLGIVQDDVLRAMPIGYFFTLGKLLSEFYDCHTWFNSVISL